MKLRTGFLLGTTLATCAQAQQSRPPVANPLQTLPITTPVAPPPAVRFTIQNHGNDALKALLARTLVPHTFEIAGAHSVPFGQVRRIFEPLNGKTVRVADLIAAADRVTALYRARGYALSFAYVPAQTFAGGVVRVVVVEGYVARLDVQGDVGTLERKIRAIAAHIVHERPLRRATFERYVQLLGRLPGAHIDVNVPAPTTTDGATTLQLSVRRTRFNLTDSLDFNHPGVQGLLTATIDGLTPLGEKLSLSLLYPTGRGAQRYDAGALTLPLGSDGLQATLGGSHYDGRPNEDFLGVPNLRRDLKQDRLDAGLNYPLQLDNEHNLSLAGGMYGSDNTDRYRNTLNNAELALETRLRVMHLELDDQRSHGKRVRKFSLGVARGLNLWGAGTAVRTNVDGASLAAAGSVGFTRYNASFVQVDEWSSHVGTSLSVAGQYSPNALPATEQITFGGPRYALAYDPGDASGDSGWGVSLELNRRYDAGMAYLKSLTPYVVAQMARVYLRHGAPVTDRLGSAGLGLRLSDNKHYAVDLTVAQPFGDKPPEANRRRPRVNLTFSYQLHQ